MIISFILYLLKICNIIDDKKITSSTQTSTNYNDVYNKTPTRYLHHLEGENDYDKEDEIFHPIEF